MRTRQRHSGLPGQCDKLPMKTTRKPNPVKLVINAEKWRTEGKIVRAGKFTIIEGQLSPK